MKTLRIAALKAASCTSVHVVVFRLALLGFDQHRSGK